MQQTMIYGNPASISQPVYQTLLQPAPFGISQPVMRSNVVQKFHRGKAIGIGTTLIIAAVIGIIVNAVEIAMGIGPGHIGHGIWIGAIVSETNLVILIINLSSAILK